MTGSPCGERGGPKLGIFMPSTGYNTRNTRYKPDPDDWTFERRKSIDHYKDTLRFERDVLPVPRELGVPPSETSAA